MAFHGKHFALLPAFFQGHFLPLVDIAKLLAMRGVIVTILVTPEFGNRIKRVMDSGLSLRVSLLKFPYAEAGLPEGSVSPDTLPPVNYMHNFYNALSMLRVQVKEVLQQLHPSPCCFIADMFFPWATDVAQQLHIPRLIFHVSSCFSLACSQMLQTSKDVAADTDYFVLPDLPDRIEITKAQLRGSPNEMSPYFADFLKEVNKSEEGAFGMVANTFEKLENEYVKRQMKVSGKKVWCLGPVSLCNKDDSDKAERGNKASLDEHDCLKWHDSHGPNSVIYVCFGSMSEQSTLQLMELCLGLEASNCPFIWVIRNASDVLRKWLVEERFEERNNGRGLLIQGWAPQVLILSHPSVGAFITHCGWNSTLEGVTAGLPMITWPLFADHFCIEKFILNVIKTGIRVGVEVPIMFGQAEDVGVQVKRDDIKMVIEELMDGEEEGRERRERARKLGEMAKSAVEEGGSSYRSVTQLIQDVIAQQAKHGD